LDTTEFTTTELGSFISNRFGDRYLYSVNRNSFNLAGSNAVYQARWKDELFADATLYVIAGTDSGLLLDYIIKRGIPDGSRYVFVEIPEIIALIDHTIPEALKTNHKINLCTVKELERVASECRISEYAYLDAVIIQKSLAVVDGFIMAYCQLWRELEGQLRLRLWRYRVEFGSCVFITRHIQNIAENRHSAAYLKNTFNNKTAVLLAGGPSLDECIPWVKQNRKHLMVAAVSRISRRLQQVDIEPDLLVTVDPHPVSFDVSKHMLMFEKPVLVNAYHATPLLMGQWRGRSLYLDTRYPWPTRDKKEKTINGMGPTVSNSAINLLMEMGFSQLILAGVDLCFSPEGFSHAEGSDERKVGAMVAYGNHTIKTNSGNIAESDNGLFTAITSIESQAEIALKKGCQLINPSPNAAAIRHVQYCPLSDIKFEPLKQPALDIILQALPQEDSTTRLESCHQAAAELERISFQLEKLKQLSRKALIYNDGLFGRNGMKGNFKYKLKMDRIEKRILKEITDTANLSKIFGMIEFVKLFRPDDSQEWSDDDIERTGQAFYNAYINGADKVLSIIKEQQQRLKSRIDEEQNPLEFEQLFEQWKNDNQPGRAVVWRLKHSDKFSALSPELKNKFTRLEASLNTEIARTDHGYMAEINQFAALRGVNGKALEQYQNRDSVGLRRLISGLKSREETEAQELTKLAQGYLAEVEQHNDDALKHYTQIIINPHNTDNAYLENALMRASILLLSSNQFELSIQYLKRLSSLSISYMPFYADMLRITNNMDAALDAYTLYITKVPDDLIVMMKLAQLYQKLGINESARWLFNHIVTNDPNNEVAKFYLSNLDLAS